jgi:KaiC/GvpD/RAD55 family RecA-like ATPase
MEERITTGIKELDEMLGGGLLPKQVIVIAGPPGAGKTIASLQFIYANANLGKKCLFISATDDEASIIENSLRFGWDFRPYLQSEQLVLKTMKLIEVEAGLASNILEQIPMIIKDARAEIVVIDSITEFQDMCQSEFERKGRTMDLRWTIKEIGGTAILTAEASTGSGITKYGIAEYVSDGVILQSRFTSEDLSEFLHVIQIIKMRWIDHSKELRAYKITPKGIEIMSPLYTVLASAGKKREEKV